MGQSFIFQVFSYLSKVDSKGNPTGPPSFQSPGKIIYPKAWKQKKGLQLLYNL